MSETLHIVCPSCNGTNKIPKDIRDPKCGRCKTELFATKPINLNHENYNQHVEKNQIPVLVDFWAPWCGPCKAMGPVFEKVASEFKGMIRFAKVNTEEEQSIAGEKAIRSIPTLILYKNGQEVDRLSGGLDESSLKQWIRSKT